jgi:hypothetical protein
LRRRAVARVEDEVAQVHETIAEFFEGLELVELGVVSCQRWRLDLADLGDGVPAEMDQVAGRPQVVARGASSALVAALLDGLLADDQGHLEVAPERRDGVPVE